MLKIHILALVATNLGSAIFTAGFVLLIKGAPKKPKTVQPRRAHRIEAAPVAELDESADDGWYDDDDDTYPHADQPINRQRLHQAACRRQPVLLFGGQSRAAAIGDQPFSPAFESGGLCRQRDRLTPTALFIRAGQIFQQNAPGDAIDDKMMGDQQ